MGTATTWIEHEGIRILYMDHTGLDEAGILASVDDAIREVSTYESSTLYLLTDTTDSYATVATKERSEELVAIFAKKGLTHYSAAVGIKGLKKTLTKAVDSTVYFADTIDDAKDWLVSRSKSKKHK